VRVGGAGSVFAVDFTGSGALAVSVGFDSGLAGSVRGVVRGLSCVVATSPAGLVVVPVGGAVLVAVRKDSGFAVSTGSAAFGRS
jgi:hypothetical protein